MVERLKGSSRRLLLEGFGMKKLGFLGYKFVLIRLTKSLFFNNISVHAMHG